MSGHRFAVVPRLMLVMRLAVVFGFVKVRYRLKEVGKRYLVSGDCEFSGTIWLCGDA